MKAKSIPSAYTDLPRSVYVILFTRMVNAMGNFVFPFMTLLLTGKIGMGEKGAGSFLLMASIIQLPGSLLGGKLSDHTGRKKIMIIFMGLAALCYAPCAFFISEPSAMQYVPWFLILSCFFHSVAHPASSAMVNDLTCPENRQGAFSLLYMGMNVGAAIGSLLAGFLFHRYIKWIFIGDMVTTLIAIGILLVFVEETKPAREELDQAQPEITGDEKAESGGLLTVLLRRPRLLIFIFIDMVYLFIYAQTSYGIPLQAKAIFGETLGARYYGTLNMINCIEVILFTTLITMLTRKTKALYNIAKAGIFYGIGFGMLFFVRNFWMFVISTIIWTMGEIISATNVGVYIADHTPMSHRGRFHSLVSIISGTGGALSPYIMGAYIQRYGVNNVWPVIFLLGIAASAAICMLGRTEN